MELALEQAERMIEGAKQKARQLGRKMSFVVLDSAGITVAAVRMDGAGKLTPRLAQAKAFTAVVFRRPSGEAAALGKERPQLLEALTEITGGAMFPAEGGLPLMLDGELVGALGASGAVPAEDLQCAQAGLAAIGVPS